MLILRHDIKPMKGAGAMRTVNWKEKRENAYCEITPAIMTLKEQ